MRSRGLHFAAGCVGGPNLDQLCRRGHRGRFHQCVSVRRSSRRRSGRLRGIRSARASALAAPDCAGGSVAGALCSAWAPGCGMAAGIAHKDLVALGRPVAVRRPVDAVVPLLSYVRLWVCSACLDTKMPNRRAAPPPTPTAPMRPTATARDVRLWVFVSLPMAHHPKPFLPRPCPPSLLFIDLCAFLIKKKKLKISSKTQKSETDAGEETPRRERGGV